MPRGVKAIETISVLDYAGSHRLTVIEVYRLIDEGKIKTIKKGKKVVIVK